MIRKILIVAAAVSAVSLCGSAPALAHANLASSDPASGAVLTTAPTQVTMNFTEAPDPSLSVVEILNVGGSVVPGVGAPSLQPPRTLTVALPDQLPDGVYTVSWRVVSSTDGHVTAGTFAFGVGQTPTGAPTAAVPTAPGPTPLSVMAKSALYVGLMLLVGIAIVGLWAFGGAPRSLPFVALVGGVVALFGAVGMLIAEQRAVGVSMRAFLRTPTGRPYVWLIVVVLVADAFVVVARMRERWRTALWGAGVAAAVAMLIRATSGHAGAAPVPHLEEAYQWIHFLAAGAWAGGIVLLVLLFRERSRTEGIGPPVREARRFSNVALVAIAIVVATGLVRAVAELGGIGNVLDGIGTAYGTTLLVKVGLVLVIVVLGAINRFRSVPRLADGDRPLRRVAGVEIVAALGVLALTATLTGLDPPASSAAAQPGQTTPAAVTASGSDFGTTTQVTLTMTPGYPGPNEFAARVTGYGTNAPLAASAVTLRFVSVTRPQLAPSQLPLKQQGDTWIAQGSQLSVAGTWRMTALVRTGASTAEVPLTVVTRSQGSTSTVAAPNQPTTATTSFADGVSLQSFIESTTAGPNQLHVTAFAPDGSELALRDLVAVTSPDIGEPERLKVIRFSAGHFGVNATFDVGTWTIDLVGTTRDGKAYQSTWTVTITP